MKNLKITGFCIWFFAAHLQAQISVPLKKSDYYTIAGDSAYKYIWKIRMQDADGKEEYTMTGFKLADNVHLESKKAKNNNEPKAYLASALHGWAKAKADFNNNVKVSADFYTIEKNRHIGARIECSVKVVSMNLEKDLVIFELIGCHHNGEPKPIFEPLKSPYINEGLKIGVFRDSAKYIAYGFPGTKDLQPNVVTVSPNAYSTIFKLVNSNPKQLEQIEKLKSPNVDIDVITMMANDIQPGLSGSPLVNQKNLEVIGMGDGAVLNQFNAQVKSWAITLGLKDIVSPKYDNIDNTVAAYKLLLKQYTPGLFSSKASSYIEGTVTKVAYPIASPRILLSLLYKPGIKGVDYFNISDIKSKTTSTSAVFDASIDITPFKKLPKLLFGFYFNKSDLKYEIQTKDDNGLPPNIETKKYTKNNQLLGLQTTLLVSQGTLHHVYVGTGLGGSLSSFKVINNYRVFAGYRKYLFHRQKISLDAKALGIITKESFLLPNPFGNAVLKNSNLNQLYLCLGINFSI